MGWFRPSGKLDSHGEGVFQKGGGGVFPFLKGTKVRAVRSSKAVVLGLGRKKKKSRRKRVKGSWGEALKQLQQREVEVRLGRGGRSFPCKLTFRKGKNEAMREGGKESLSCYSLLGKQGKY